MCGIIWVGLDQTRDIIRATINFFYKFIGNDNFDSFIELLFF